MNESMYSADSDLCDCLVDSLDLASSTGTVATATFAVRVAQLRSVRERLHGKSELEINAYFHTLT
jgi:hypothetical protein